MAEEKLKNLNANITSSREGLVKLWSESNSAPVSSACAKTWNAWSANVRQDFLKRSQAAVIANVQTAVPRKQWAQWEVTLKFCLDDIFKLARAQTDKEFGAKDGLGDLIGLIVEGKEHTLDPIAFEKKIGEMLEEMKNTKVDGFDVNDQSHGPTLKAIKSIYAIQWAQYVVVKLSTN
jgi:hypothetical protein